MFEARIVHRVAAVVAAFTLTALGLVAIAPGAKAAPAGFITRDGSKLMLNGSQYKFAGLNADTWFGCWPNEIPTDADLDKYFSELNPHSMTRIWPYSGTDLSIMDRIVASAEKYGQYLAPSLQDGNADCGMPEVNYGNPTFELAWVNEIVPRYAESPAIGFWEIINEPDGGNAQLKSYYTKISQAIRAADPNHLIGTGNHMGAMQGSIDKYIDDHDIATIDLISMHEYDAETGPSNHESESVQAAEALNKPWYAGEDGFCCGGGSEGAEGNAQKLADEWKGYLDIPTCAGMLYWDFKLSNKDADTVSFGTPMWETAKSFEHPFTGGAGGATTGAGTATTPKATPKATTPKATKPATGVLPTGDDEVTPIVDNPVDADEGVPAATAPKKKATTPTATEAGVIDDASNFAYEGTWENSADFDSTSNSFGGGDHFSRTAGSTATLRFNGTGVKLYGITDAHHGTATVQIDNLDPVTVNFYSANRVDDVLVFTSRTLGAGPHTLTITVSGKRSTASTDTVVSIDRAVVSGGSTPAAMPGASTTGAAAVPSASRQG